MNKDKTFMHILKHIPRVYFIMSMTNDSFDHNIEKTNPTLTFAGAIFIWLSTACKSIRFLSLILCVYAVWLTNFMTDHPLLGQRSLDDSQSHQRAARLVKHPFLGSHSSLIISIYSSLLPPATRINKIVGTMLFRPQSAADSANDAPIRAMNEWVLC